MSTEWPVIGRDDRDIIRARLIRRIEGVRSITDLPVAHGDVALEMASDVIDIVLTHASQLIVAAERERIAQAIDTEERTASRAKHRTGLRIAARIARRHPEGDPA